MVPAYFFMSIKDDGVQWIYYYIIHERWHKMDLGALRNVALKHANEYATQCILFGALCFM